MQKFYAAIDEKTAQYVVCLSLDGSEVARCDSEDWSCAVTAALNLIDGLSNELAGFWPVSG